MAAEREDSVFHAGEQAAQARAGVRERIEQVGREIIRDVMPEQHRELFEKLPMFLVGSLDTAQRPWASILAGPPGFITSPDAQTLQIHARPLPGDPLAAHLRVGAPLGLLGIELETRRRNRVNGAVVAVAGDVFAVCVQQSFGDCPKYIQARSARWVTATAPSTVSRHREGAALSAEASALIRRADTFFIATAAPAALDGSGHAAHGVDVSHRGGRPGFVQVNEEPHGTLLTVPDFVGNYMFNSIGNLMANPRAGLLFVDFDTGDVLGLTGDTEVVWDGPEMLQFRGAQRLLRVRVATGWGVRAALPLHFGPPELSPHLEAIEV